jgi:hypothetical protein
VRSALAAAFLEVEFDLTVEAPATANCMASHLSTDPFLSIWWVDGPDQAAVLAALAAAGAVLTAGVDDGFTLAVDQVTVVGELNQQRTLYPCALALLRAKLAAVRSGLSAGLYTEPVLGATLAALGTAEPGWSPVEELAATLFLDTFGNDAPRRLGDTFGHLRMLDETLTDSVVRQYWDMACTVLGAPVP